MKTTPRSDADARRVSRPKCLTGWFAAHFRKASEHPSLRGNDTVEVMLTVRDGEGQEREFRDWLTNTVFGAAKLRHACEAVGALAKYEAGEISHADFPGHDCRVRLGVEKRRGYPERNVVEDYAAPAAGVVNLREAG